jgi:hypothetical protein
MRRLLALLALLAGSCSHSPAGIALTVDSDGPLTSIGRLTVIISDGVRTSEATLATDFSFPPAQQFQLTLDQTTAIDLTLTVEAFDPGGARMASASTKTHFDPAAGAKAKIVLAGGVASFDGGSPDATPALAFALAPPAEFPCGTYPEGLALADFDGDGAVDAVTGSFQSGILFLKGHGDGTLGAPTSQAWVMDNAAEVAFDWNGDGRPDIAVADATPEVRILVGKGDGTFATWGPPTPLSKAHSGTTLEPGDWNGDGRLDLAVSNDVDGVVVLLAKADGSLELRHAPDVGEGGAGGLAAGDFDGDGKLDLLAAHGDSLVFLPGLGDGNFGPIRTTATNGACYVVRAADWDGDGHLDAATGLDPYNTGPAHNLTLFHGKGDGTFEWVRDYDTAFSALADGAVADLNQDGYPDLIVSSVIGYEVSVFLGNGSGLDPAQFFVTHSGPFAVRVADFNGDQLPDIAVTNGFSADITLLLNRSH